MRLNFISAFLELINLALLIWRQIKKSNSLMKAGNEMAAISFELLLVYFSLIAGLLNWFLKFEFLDWIYLTECLQSIKWNQKWKLAEIKLRQSRHQTSTISGNQLIQQIKLNSAMKSEWNCWRQQLNSDLLTEFAVWLSWIRLPKLTDRKPLSLIAVSFSI